VEIRQHQHGAVVAIKPVGPVTDTDAEKLKTQLLEVRTASLGRLVLDLSGVPFIDSQGLESLLDVTEELGRSGQALKLCGENEIIREVFELTDLASSFEHFDDVTSAVRSFM
jgi:stage II sporulation protein AA (anti-sigma F factor antagonist)